MSESINSVHFSRFKELNAGGKLSHSEYVAGVLSCEAGDEHSSDATESFTYGWSSQHQIEQNAGARRGVQQF